MNPNKTAAKKPNPQAKQAKKEPKPKAQPWVPADPVAARTWDRPADVEKAIEAVHDGLVEAELDYDHASALAAARDFFDSQKFHDTFRFLILLAYDGGKKA